MGTVGFKKNDNNTVVCIVLLGEKIISSEKNRLSFCQWNSREFALEFTAGPLNFVHVVDMCVMKVPKLQTACPHSTAAAVMPYNNTKRDDLLHCLFVWHAKCLKSILQRA